MSDVRYTITVDDKGAIKSIKDFSGALDDSKKVAGETESKFGGLWKQFAIGTLAVDALKKGFGLLKDFVGGSITAAMDSETAQKNLETALATTGRTVSAMLPDLTNFADEIMRQTIVDNEAAKGALALMVQLTDLNEEGLEKATEGAIGLANVFNIDLETASRAVAKAMGGEMDLLGRYLPQVYNLKTEEEKHALVMQTLGTWYQRATAETGTFSGQLSQLKNWWGEVKESVGKAITENESLRQTIKDITLSIRELVESGKLEDWISKTIAGIQTVIDLLGKVPEGITGLGNALAGEITGINATMGRLESEGRAKVFAFRDSLLVLKPPIEELRKEIEKGPDSWNAYTTSMRETDNKLADNKETIKSWFTEAGKMIGFFKDVKPPIKETGDAIGDISKKQKEVNVEIPPLLAFLKGQYKQTADDIDGYFKLATDALHESCKDSSYEAALDIVNNFKFAGDEIPKPMKTATDTSKGYFDGLFNDIAKGFGDSASGLIGDICKGLNFADGEFFKHGINFKKYFKEAFEDIKDAFFRMIGEMIADKVLGLFKGFFSSVASEGKTALSGIASAAGGIGQAAGSAASGFLSAAGSIGSIVSGITGIISLFKGPEKQGDVTYWLKFIKDNTQVLRNYFEGGIAADITNTARALCGSIPEKLDNIFSMIDMSRIDLVDIGEQIKEGVYGTWDVLKGIKIGQYGFNEIATRPTLYMAEPGERVIMVPPGRPNITNSSAFNFHFSVSTLDADSFHGIFMKKIVPLLNEYSKYGPIKIHDSSIVSH